MATTMMRTSLRAALRGGPRGGTPASKRTFASSRHHDDASIPILHILNKEFPWGPDGLFERKKH